MTDSKVSRKASERRRLAAALRENLKRRKAQARHRSPAADGRRTVPEPQDSAGIDEHKGGRDAAPHKA